MVAKIFAALAVSVAATDLSFEDDALSLLQHRALLDVGKLSPALDQVSSGELDFGKDVIERPFVDENNCDEGICVYEALDNSLGAMQGNGVITGVRFYAARAGNYGLRFRAYRALGGQYLLTGQTEEIEVPTVGIQEYTFTTPLPFLYEDWIGFYHNGHGNIAYSEGQPGDGHVSYNSNKGITPMPPGPPLGWDQRGCFGFVMHGKPGYTTPSGADDRGFASRSYSYSFITRAPANSDYNDQNLCSQPRPAGLPDFAPAPEPAEEPAPEPAAEPEGDAAAAVGDPHMSTNSGKHFDMH